MYFECHIMGCIILFYPYCIWNEMDYQIEKAPQNEPILKALPSFRGDS